jgi:hypothetical protein
MGTEFARNETMFEVTATAYQKLFAARGSVLHSNLWNEISSNSEAARFQSDKK